MAFSERMTMVETFHHTSQSV